jgi:hypothetical protein
LYRWSNEYFGKVPSDSFTGIKYLSTILQNIKSWA